MAKKTLSHLFNDSKSYCFTNLLIYSAKFILRAFHRVDLVTLRSEAVATLWKKLQTMVSEGAAVQSIFALASHFVCYCNVDWID